MLRAVRERNERSLPDTGLPFLFDSTCDAIFALLEQLAQARAVSLFIFCLFHSTSMRRLVPDTPSWNSFKEEEGALNISCDFCNFV